METFLLARVLKKQRRLRRKEYLIQEERCREDVGGQWKGQGDRAKEREGSGKETRLAPFTVALSINSYVLPLTRRSLVKPSIDRCHQMLGETV